MKVSLATALCVLMVSACGSSGGGAEAKQGEVCGSISCADGLYCKHALGDCGELSENSGVCEVTPEMCAQMYLPVCGCDGKTYSNECVASSNGISVRASGACEQK